MSNNYVQVAPNSTGLKVDTSELVVSSNTVERQNVCVADPSTAANVANVTASGALKVDASATTQPVSLASLPALAAGSAAIGTVVLSDGTNTPNVVSGDTGQNSLIVSRGRKSVAFTTTTAQAVASTDVSNYSWVSVHTTSNGTSSTINFQGSNDNVNWVAVGLLQSSNAGSSNPATAITSAGTIYVGALSFRYFQLNVTGISAGTTAGTVEFFTMAPTLPTSAITLNGTSTVTFLANTSTSLSNARLISAATTNATSVKTTVGNLYNIQAYNVNAANRYLKLYNKASAPTVGTDTPVATHVLPGNATGSAVVIEMTQGMSFPLGIAFAITAAMADSDTTAIGAGDVIVNLQYK